MHHICSGKSGLTIAAFAGFAFGAPAENAQFALFDGFEDETIGLIDGQDGWDSSGGENSVVVDPWDPTNQVMYVPSSSSTLHKSMLAEHLAVLDGTAKMMFFRMCVAEKQTFSVGVSPMSHPSEYSDFGPEIGMANSAQNLDVRVWDDDEGNYENVTNLTADNWYNVWLYVDADQNVYRLWMNNTPGADASPDDLLMDESGDDTFEFRVGDSSSFITFYIKTSGGSSGTNFGPVYFDDIYVELSEGVNLTNPTTGCVVDLNGDGIVDLGDISVFTTGFLAGDPVADLTGDGVLDLYDVTAFVLLFLAGCP
ncbi:MAG: hypothetical protein H6810_08950 [Phycisphaeraceae bacterium]|nr:MAG: hypothetical protein H6810_08950 [Phycisphaeraceae bacterium]